MRNTPTDKNAASKLALLLLAERDDPIAALKCAENAGDAALFSMLALAAKATSACDEEESLRLAAWLQAQSAGVSELGARNLLLRAQRCYHRFIALHEKNDAAKVAATMALADLEKVLLKDTTPEQSAADVAEVVTESGIQWRVLQLNAASIDSVNHTAIPLVQAMDDKGWTRVPADLARAGALIYSQDAAGPHAIAEFTVTRSGYLLLACNFDYQGNSSGDWIQTRMTRDDLIKQGWREINEKALGGTLVGGGSSREQVVFWRFVKEAEHYRLRCNKYDPPYVIVLTDTQRASEPARVPPARRRASTHPRLVRRIVISDQLERGYVIGPTRKGSRIVLRYCGGTWKGWGMYPTESPDAPQAAQGERCRLVIADGSEKERSRVLAIVPPETQRTPFSWTADRDYDDLILRINDGDGDWRSNPWGHVTYDLALFDP